MDVNGAFLCGGTVFAGFSTTTSAIAKSQEMEVADEEVGKSKVALDMAEKVEVR